MEKNILRRKLILETKIQILNIRAKATSRDNL